MFQNLNLLLQYTTAPAGATIIPSNRALLAATRVALEAVWLAGWTASIPLVPQMCRCSIDICESAGYGIAPQLALRPPLARVVAVCLGGALTSGMCLRAAWSTCAEV